MLKSGQVRDAVRGTEPALHGGDFGLTDRLAGFFSQFHFKRLAQYGIGDVGLGTFGRRFAVG